MPPWRRRAGALSRPRGRGARLQGADWNSCSRPWARGGPGAAASGSSWRLPYGVLDVVPAGIAGIERGRAQPEEEQADPRPHRARDPGSESIPDDARDSKLDEERLLQAFPRVRDRLQVARASPVLQVPVAG